jgi:hypothetical protein
MSYIGATAQPYIIKGSVSDTVNNFPLEYASITLLSAKDSILETFTRTKADGSFTLEAGNPGKYVLMITFPGFADYIDKVEVKDNTPVDMGPLPMVSKTHLLQEFVFTQQYSAIKVKGDTLEYVADSFKVNGGANVESLLKKLPGIQVDKDGKIVAQGEKVEKLLVDGEEFFSDDPAVVSKSLQADAVDKVQVFDKKSDQAEFTGIDDGEKTRTINLQLKEDKKKGYFGKISAAGGAGTDQTFFENQAMVNGFKGKRKLAGFGIMANTGKLGLGWEDRDKFGGGSGNAEMTEDGMMYTSWDDGMDGFGGWDGTYNGQGLPKAWTGGLHYSNKWKEDKHHFSSNYRGAKQNIETTHNILTENYLPGNAKYFTEQQNDDFSSGFRNRVDGLYEWKPDTTTTVKLTANVNHYTVEKRSNYFSRNFTQDSVTGGRNLLNDSRREIDNEATTDNFSTTLSWKQKLKKKGRTFSVNLTQKYSETQGTGLLRSWNNYYNNGISGDTVNQQKENNNSSLSLANNLSYTEPLSKIAFLELNYGLKVDNNAAERKTFNKTNPQSDVYDSLDNRFSSNYAFNVLTNTGGSKLRFVYEKINFSFGGSVSNARFVQNDLLADTGINYQFTNFFPSANFIYKFSKQSRFSLNYSGSTKQPTLQQIQPLRDNTDPLNIAIGNPNITQEFNHNFNTSFNDYKVLSGRWIWMNGSINFVDNAISRSENIDATGRKTYQYINVDGNFNSWLWAGLGGTIKSIGLRYGAHINPSFSHFSNVINGVKNQSDYNSYTGGLDFSYDSEDEKFSIYLEPEFSYNDNRTQVNTQTTNFWTINTDFNASYKLPLKFIVTTEVEWYIRQQTSVFDQNNNVFRWNASVSKKFLKNDVLELKASVFDILNQNIGFNRFAQNNYITQDNYNTIRRYGLLSLSWNFTKSPLSAPAENNVIIQK